MPGPWWEWVLGAVLWTSLPALLWWQRDLLRPIPGLLVEWLEDVAYRLEREPDPEECTCRGTWDGGTAVPVPEPVAIHAWELGDTLETGATGPVIDHRCPTCWLPRRPLPRPPSGTGGGSKPQPPRGPGAVVTGPQPPETGGVRFGGERQAIYWGDRNAGPQVHARLSDGTTRTFPTEEEAKAWILSTRLPDPGKSQRH